MDAALKLPDINSICYIYVGSRILKKQSIDTMEVNLPVKQTGLYL